jgi:tetratricopeptide (TPR) repeat protein
VKLTTSARRVSTACATILFLFLYVQSLGAQHIGWTPEARSAHGLITALRVEEGLTAIRLQRIQHPDNLIWTYLEDYGEFLSIFIREDLRRIPAYREASTARLEKLEALPETEPLALMAQAQLSLHQCALQLQESQFIAAGTSINKAFKLLKRNHRLHPGDAGTLRLYAALKAAFGAIPDQYRWLVAMLTSLTGSIEEGLRELHGLLENTRPADNPFYKETVLFTALAEGKLNDRPEEAARLLVQHYGQSPPDKAVQFTMAHILMAAGQNDAAIRALEANLPGTPVPFMDFMLGQCKLYRGDKDADVPFQQFLRQHKGKHYIKEAYQKLAWHALLRDDRPGYVRNMQQVLIRGSATTDEDKQALREAEYHQTPHPALLRARLSFDGGYHQKALDVLSDDLYKTLGQHLHRLEFLYRKGRVFQARRQFAEALHYFHLAINMGRYDTAYYACSAALQCGLIHERLGHKAEAATYYDMCLEFAPETYASGLHQEARIGLNRIGY